MTTYLTGPQVLERYNIATATLDRWLKDERLGFPKPMIVRRHRFFPEEELIAWERKRAGRASA